MYTAVSRKAVVPRHKIVRDNAERYHESEMAVYGSLFEA